MRDPRTFVIVAGGLAGAKAAEAPGTEGIDGRIVMVEAQSGHGTRPRGVSGRS